MEVFDLTYRYLLAKLADIDLVNPRDYFIACKPYD
jgi:hypothetical protein